MNTPLQRLVDALREELQHCGAVLALLDAGPGVLFPSVPPAAAPSPAQFEEAASRLAASRARRERCQQQLAWACHQPDAWAAEDLLPGTPPAMQPLLTALFAETHSLQDQIRTRLHPGHPWLGPEVSLLLAARPVPHPAVTAGFTRRPQPDSLSA